MEQSLTELEATKNEWGKLKNDAFTLQSNYELYEKLRKLFEHVIVADPVLARTKTIESSYWKACFYRFHEAYRTLKLKAKKDMDDVMKKRCAVEHELFLTAAIGHLSQLILLLSLKHNVPELSDLLTGLNVTLPADVLEDPGVRGACFYISLQVLIFCGDLARYCSDYSQNFSQVASVCYNQALIINPGCGAAFNQLAVLAGKCGDNVGQLFFYFRSIISSSPFPRALDNIPLALKQIINQPESEPWLVVWVKFYTDMFYMDGSFGLKGLENGRMLVGLEDKSPFTILKLTIMNISAYFQAKKNAKNVPLAGKLMVTWTKFLLDLFSKKQQSSLRILLIFFWCNWNEIQTDISAGDLLEIFPILNEILGSISSLYDLPDEGLLASDLAVLRGLAPMAAAVDHFRVIEDAANEDQDVEKKLLLRVAHDLCLLPQCPLQCKVLNNKVAFSIPSLAKELVESSSEDEDEEFVFSGRSSKFSSEKKENRNVFVADTSSPAPGFNKLVTSGDEIVHSYKSPVSPIGTKRGFSSQSQRLPSSNLVSQKGRNGFQNQEVFQRQPALSGQQQRLIDIEKNLTFMDNNLSSSLLWSSQMKPPMTRPPGLHDLEPSFGKRNLIPLAYF